MNQVKIGEVKGRYTSTGKFSSYVVQLKHVGLDEFKDVVAKDKDILTGKINNVINNWEKKWQRHLAQEEKKRIASKNEEKSNQATLRTLEAEAILKNLEKILDHTLKIDDAIDWNSLKSKKKFKAQSIEKNFDWLDYDSYSNEPKQVKQIKVPQKPAKSDFETKIPLIKILLGQRSKIEDQFRQQYDDAMLGYEKRLSKIEKDMTERRAFLTCQHSKWEAEKEDFCEQQRQQNAKVDLLQTRYINCEEEAVLEHFDLVLSNSQYPDSFPKSFELQYRPNTKMLLIEYDLPSLEDMPSLKSVAFIKSKNEFSEKHISDSQKTKLYDFVIYQICLRSLHEIFEADTAGTIEAISFNGIVDSIDRTTGRQRRSCIVSIQVQKEEFEAINLANVDAKACFKSLKGVGSSKLATLTPIKPILNLDKTDTRIVDHYDVASGIDGSTNLAAMDWLDFEHLIRELFEKEFAKDGGEVKVTKASSDGGVDAIAFDPDPIRGGKIVIQAKRYTNTVSVSAVRDLYGTVVNEGANKGILVTTADYGADSYAFASDKPVTLLNGSNLLHLLEKHGHSARIDIKEAKLSM